MHHIKRGDLSSFEYNYIIPDEIESDVIFSRPDVMEAETMLEKAKIDVRGKGGLQGLCASCALKSFKKGITVN